MLIRRVFERTTLVIENLVRFKYLINIDLVGFLLWTATEEKKRDVIVGQKYIPQFMGV